MLILVRTLSQWPHDVSSVFSLTYFYKNYIAYGKLLVKNWGFERGHSYLFHLMFIWPFFVLELGWGKVPRSLIENLRLVVHQTHHLTLHRTRPVRSVSVMCWGVHTGPAHSKVSESGAMCPVCSYRCACGIRCRRASGGPCPVTLHWNQPLYV